MDIKQSKVKFIRNGMTYEADIAYRWLLFKAMHKQFKDKPITDTCDFINRVATRSNTSGEYYQVINEQGKRQYLRHWLEEKYGIKCVLA